MISLDRSQPAVHQQESLGLESDVREQAAGTFPIDHVGGSAVVAKQTVSKFVGVPVKVLFVIAAAAEVDDRNQPQLSAADDSPRAIGGLDSTRIGRGSPSLESAIDVQPADLGVEVDELCRRDLAHQQR